MWWKPSWKRDSLVERTQSLPGQADHHLEKAQVAYCGGCSWVGLVSLSLWLRHQVCQLFKMPVDMWGQWTVMAQPETLIKKDMLNAQ